jgi:hypothetical protein
VESPQRSQRSMAHFPNGSAQRNCYRDCYEMLLSLGWGCELAGRSNRFESALEMHAKVKQWPRTTETDIDTRK